MIRSLGVTHLRDVQSFQLPADRVWVFLYAPMTEPFMIQHQQLGKQSGEVLYVIPVMKPD
jgi:hypothetical protein